MGVPDILMQDISEVSEISVGMKLHAALSFPI
jgi:hypothetical protein